MTYPGDPNYRPNQSGLMRVLEALQASFRVGRFFGVEVRMFWIALIVLPLIFLSGFLKFMAFPEALTHTVICVSLLYLIIWSHEMGHIAMGWRHKMRTPLITLSPLGGLAHMATPAPRPSAEAWVSLAGPATHLAWLAVVAPLWYLGFEGEWDLLRPESFLISPVTFAVQFLLLANFWLMCFNLLPFFPLDGGRCLRALLARKMQPGAATMIATQVGIMGAVLFIVGPFLFPNFILGNSWLLFAIGISNMMACAQERRAARFGMTPYDATAGFESWQVDPEAWRGGRSGRDRREAGEPGFFERRKDERQKRRKQRDRETAQDLESEVDRILQKVSDVGMSGLTEKEKRTLMRASENRKQR